MATLLLSEAGVRVLGGRIFPQARLEEPGVIGIMISYDDQGVWFQDERLLGQDKMVLVRWNFVDAILSEISPPEPANQREVGFR